MDNPRSALSPLTNSLLEQLEARIKELKAWLRDTELLIFNSCLRENKDASEQLQSFKVRSRRVRCTPEQSAVVLSDQLEGNYSTHDPPGAFCQEQLQVVIKDHH